MTNVLPSEILLHQSEDGDARVDVRLFDESVWLTQAQMAKLFDKDVRTINEHIVNVRRRRIGRGGNDPEILTAQPKDITYASRMSLIMSAFSTTDP